MELNHLKTISRKVYYCKQFNLHRNNLKATWKLIGTLIKRKTKGQTSPSRIIMNNKTHTNKLDVADHFNKYFISVGQSLASTIDHYDEEPTKYITKSPVSSFIVSPVEATQVSGADTGGVDRVDIHPPFFSKKKFEMSLYLK